MIRVLVVDDSPYVRKVVSDMLSAVPEITVVGTAGTGREALVQLRELQPDIVTLDLNMPGMNGAEFLREQQRRAPVRAILLTSAAQDEPLAAEALEAGAMEFVRKPTTLANFTLTRVQNELVEKVLTLGKIPLERWRPRPDVCFHPRSEAGTAAGRAAVLGLSTGGPQHLRHFVSSLKEPLRFPLAAVIHMPPGFTGPFAERLNSMGPTEVVEASPGLAMKPGRMILGHAGRHLSLARDAVGQVTAQLLPGTAEELHCPSVDVLFQSAAQAYGQGLLGAVFTGMGNDGTVGAAWIKAQGGRVLTESEESCTVYGMPRSVVQAGLSDESWPVDELLRRVCDWA